MHACRSGSIEVSVQQPVPPGHKVALQAIQVGEEVYKFGYPIGRASANIQPGEHVHVHNLRTDHQIDLEAIATDIPEPFPPQQHHFLGYRRSTGKVGTRNYVAVISNVNCSASVARMVAQQFGEQELQDFPNVDGVISFRHEAGCAMAWDGIRHRMLNDVLGGMAQHPNIGGFLLVGLGLRTGNARPLGEYTAAAPD